MSVFDMFRTAPANQAAPATPGNIPAQESNLTAPGNTTVPAGDPSTQGNPAQAGQEGAPTSDSPLDQFKDLWHTEPNKDAPEQQEAIVPSLAPEDVQKALANHDFTQGITQDQLAAISAGGEEAQQAFAQALNAVSRQVMTSSTLVTNKLVEQAVTKALEQQAAKMPSMLRSQAAQNHLKDTNPIFSNPAVQPIVEATQERLLQKFPNATPAEITKMTEDFVLAMGQEFAPKPAESSTTINATDWEKFLSN